MGKFFRSGLKFTPRIPNILLVAVIAVIAGVGGWINGQWTNLNAALP